MILIFSSFISCRIIDNSIGPKFSFRIIVLVILFPV